MRDLFQRWRELLPQPTAARLGEELLTRWAQPHRRYHTLNHLAHVLLIIDEYERWAADPMTVRLAAWFHDCVYEPARIDNEEASALFAERCLDPLGLRAGQVSAVARLVRLTATHDPDPTDADGCLLTDADLAILAAEAHEYEQYRAAIRLEYAHLSDQVFTAGRSAVLHNLLSLPRLFHTPVLRDRLEAPARANLTRELSALQATPAPH